MTAILKNKFVCGRRNRDIGVKKVRFKDNNHEKSKKAWPDPIYSLI
jgi:hypothetical protein